MVDWIVCGEFASISCSTWSSFWSGAVGAVVAAVLSAFVALLVVRLTNAQQRHGVERTVEIAALADCVAALEGLDWALSVREDTSSIFDTGPHLIPMRSAVARLQMSRKEAVPVAGLLIHWPSRIGRLATQYQRAALRGAPFAGDVLASLSEIATIATVCLPRCTSRSKSERIDALKMLGNADKKLIADLEKFNALIDPESEQGAKGDPAPSMTPESTSSESM